MRKPTFCICENKSADQLSGNCAGIHHGGATNAHDASKIRYGASTVQAGCATTSSSCCILDEL